MGKQMHIVLIIIIGKRLLGGRYRRDIKMDLK
jgi:hypothetical protein